MNSSLVFFNKEGDYLNITYNTSTERYEGDLLFHENSSDTYKTIGLYLFENVPSFEYENPGSLNLQKFQLFNEHGLNFVGSKYQTQSVTKLESINNDAQFYSKWIYGVDFEKKYPVGSQIIFNQPFVEFINLNQSFTIVSTKKGASMIISNVDNQSFNNLYSSFLGLSSSYTNISISGVNSVGVYNYVDSSLTNKLSSWSEPDFYTKYFNDRKLNLIGTEKNDSVVTIKNKDILDKVYYTYYTDGATLTQSSTLIAEVILRTDLPLVYSGGITVDVDKVRFVDVVPSILKPGTQFSIVGGSLNQNFITVAPILTFLGNTNLTYYATQSQVIYNNKIWECLQGYTQSATSSVLPNTSPDYWTDNITYLPVVELLTPESLGYAQIYLTTNKFYYSYDHDNVQSTEVTLASFAEKYHSDFDIFNINLYYNTTSKKLNSDLVYPSKYAEISYYVDQVGLSYSITSNQFKYENNIQVEENLITELNRNFSERWSYNIVFTDIDEYGIKVYINGMVYQEEVKWVYTGPSIDMVRTIDKTLRSWLSKHYVRIYTLGITSKVYYTGGGNSVYYNSINLTTQYPNVPIEFEVEVGTTADFHIQHSRVVFYDMGSNLEITVNGIAYGLSASVDIPTTLSRWIDDYQFVLDDYGIYVSNTNNLLTFNTKSQDQRLDYTIRIGKSSLPGEVPFEITDRSFGNQGSLITSNSMTLPVDGTTYSFLDSGFATGMITTVNNTLYPYNNQQYNILYVNDLDINFSYQGPFWSTDDAYCDSAPFTTIAFSLGFGATGCPPDPTPLSGGGSFTYSQFDPSFSLIYQSTNTYQQELYNGTSYMVDLTYLQLSERVYVLGGDLLSVDATTGDIDNTISLTGNTQSICLRFNSYNNYLYALTNNLLYAIDPIIDVIIATMSLSGIPYDCVVNDSNGDVYVSYSDVNQLDVWSYTNTSLSGISTESVPYSMVYNISDSDIYINLNNDVVTRVKGSNRLITLTYSVPGLTGSLLYEPSDSSIIVFGDYVTKIDGGSASTFATSKGDDFNFSFFDNLNGNIILSISSTSSTLVAALNSEGTESWNESSVDYGQMSISQFDGDIYLSSRIDNSVLVIDSTTGHVKHTESFGSLVSKTIYNPSRNSMWGLQPGNNKIIEILTTLGSSISLSTTPEVVTLESQYGTLDPNYVAKDHLWIKTAPYIRRPRQNYQSDNSQVKYVYKWLDDQVPQMFMYDFTGNQLSTGDPLSYTGEKPLDIVSLNKTPNKNIDLISYSEYQQTIFSEVVETLDYIDSETSLTYLPEPLELFIGFNSDEEGVTTSTLILYERETITLTFTPNSTNNDVITFTLVSDSINGDYGKIDLDTNSDDNFLFDTNGDKTGLKVGQLLKFMLSDITNYKNKFVSFNNAKVFKVRQIYMRSIIVDFIDDIIVDESNVISDYPKVGNTTYLKTIIKVTDKEVGRFNVMGQTEIEDERFRIELSNTGKLISADNIYIFKEYDINEEGVDWSFMNKKRKEMLMVRHDIFPYVGSYKAIINAINYFGYNDLELYEYYRDINPDSTNYQKLFKVEIPDIFDNSVEGWTENDFIKHTMPNKNYSDTNLFNLTYYITDKEGNNLLTYSLKEVLMKLQGLKYWLQSNVIPITHKILDITGRADFVGYNTIVHKSYDTKTVNIRQSMSPVDFKINEAYLMPINSGSLVYNVVVDFVTATSSLVPDYFDICVRTYKTYREWSPFTTYNIGDRVTYYDQLYESDIDNNRIKNPRKYENISSWNASINYIPSQFVNYNHKIYEYLGSTYSTINPELDTDWVDLTEWRKINFVPVQTIKEYRTGTHSFSFTIDSNLDPFMSIEVTSDNGYGQIYTSKKNYEIRGLKDLSDGVSLIEKDPLPKRLPAPPSSLPLPTTTSTTSTSTSTTSTSTTSTTTTSTTTTTTTTLSVVKLFTRNLTMLSPIAAFDFRYNISGCNLNNFLCFPISTKPPGSLSWTNTTSVPINPGIDIINIIIDAPLGSTGTLTVDLMSGLTNIFTATIGTVVGGSGPSIISYLVPNLPFTEFILSYQVI